MFTVLVLLLQIVIAVRGQPLPSRCEGQWNTKPIYSDPPRFIRSVKNGKLYLLDKVDPPISVVHLWGDHYEMGLAWGQIMKQEMHDFIPQMIEYGVNQTVEWLVKELHLPRNIARTIAYRAVMSGLELTWELTRAYTPKHFVDEIRGVADGSGLDFNLVNCLNQIPEFLKAACAMIGAWGDAIKNVKGSSLFQLRALDWAEDGPVYDFPTVVVYHPDPIKVPGSAPFATWGYPAFVGTVTGYSSRRVGMSEKLSSPDGYNATGSRIGYPWHYLVRDILEFDQGVPEALARMKNAKRTCSVWLGVGDNNMKQFRMVAYGHQYLYVYDDANCPSGSDHPRFPGVIYNDPHPGNPCISELIQNYYGSIDANAIINMTAADNTGYTHIAIYDYANDYMYLASGSSNKRPPVVHAALRSYVKLEMQKYWAEPRPNYKD